MGPKKRARTLTTASNRILFASNVILMPFGTFWSLFGKIVFFTIFSTFWPLGVGGDRDFPVLDRFGHFDQNGQKIPKNILNRS